MISAPREPQFPLSARTEANSASVVDLARAGGNAVKMGGNAARWAFEHPLEVGALATLAPLMFQGNAQMQAATRRVREMAPLISTLGAWGSRFMGPKAQKIQDFAVSLPYFSKAADEFVRGDIRAGVSDLVHGYVKGKIVDMAGHLAQRLPGGRFTYIATTTIASPVGDLIGGVAGRFAENLVGSRSDPSSSLGRTNSLGNARGTESRLPSAQSDRHPLRVALETSSDTLPSFALPPSASNGRQVALLATRTQGRERHIREGRAL